MLFLVLTSGFKAWTRNSEFWSHTEEKWGFTLASYALLAAFVLLILLSRLPFIIGEGAFRPGLEDGPILRGVSAILPEEVERNSKIKRIGLGILNSV